MLSRWSAAAAAILLLGCSDPDAYPGGGRFETLPGQMGGTLVPADAGASPGDDGVPPTDAAMGETGGG